MRENAEKIAENAIENAVLLEWCLPLETSMFRLVLHNWALKAWTQLGAQSIVMEQLSAVVQLKNITD